MNGTRLIVKRLMKNIIVATILTGVATGEEVLIARIGLIPSDCFVEFKQVQFPVNSAFFSPGIRPKDRLTNMPAFT